MSEAFSRWSARIAFISGYWESFVLMTGICLLWAVSGPFFGFSDTWQLVINTATTVLTFLMVFLIQNTQNRDAKAIHLKLDELIRAVQGARNQLVDLEDLSDAELEKLQQEFHQLHLQYASQAHEVSKISGRRRAEDR